MRLSDKTLEQDKDILSELEADGITLAQDKEHPDKTHVRFKGREIGSYETSVDENAQYGNKLKLRINCGDECYKETAHSFSDWPRINEHIANTMCNQTSRIQGRGETSTLPQDVAMLTYLATASVNRKHELSDEREEMFGEAGNAYLNLVKKTIEYARILTTDHPKPLQENNRYIFELRKVLKDQFLDALASQPNPFADRGEGYGIRIFGSTTLYLDNDVKLIVPRYKSDDIDIVVQTPVGAKLSLDEMKQLDKTGLQTIDDAINQVGLPIKDLPVSAGYDPSHDRMLVHHFTVDEIEALDLPHKDDLMTYARRLGGSLDVDLKINTSSEQRLPNLMEPRAYNRMNDAESSKDTIPLYLSDWRSALARRLSRSMSFTADGYEGKASDILSVYNILNADPPLVDMDPRNGSGTEGRLIRLLTLVNFAAMGTDLNACDFRKCALDPEFQPISVDDSKAKHRNVSDWKIFTSLSQETLLWPCVKGHFHA